jgi:amino acid permease
MEDKYNDNTFEAPGRPSNQDSADQLLENLGYKAELSRNRSTWQVAFMSFVLASIPYGLATTLYYPLIGGGPVNIIWGWVAVSIIIVCVAASLGEITSVYPTAGGMSQIERLGGALRSCNVTSSTRALITNIFFQFQVSITRPSCSRPPDGVA